MRQESGGEMTRAGWNRALWNWRLCAALVSAAILSPGISLDPTSGRPGFRGAHAASACAADPQPTISPQTPSDVCIANFNILPIQFFDDYSWRTFISLVWPADLNRRGQPDTTLKLGDTSRPLVFETYKADWELFPDQPTDPGPWNAVAAKQSLQAGEGRPRRHDPGQLLEIRQSGRSRVSARRAARRHPGRAEQDLCAVLDRLQ